MAPPPTDTRSARGRDPPRPSSRSVRLGDVYMADFSILPDARNVHSILPRCAPAGRLPRLGLREQRRRSVLISDAALPAVQKESQMTDNLREFVRSLFHRPDPETE